MNKNTIKSEQAKILDDISAILKEGGKTYDMIPKIESALAKDPASRFSVDALVIPPFLKREKRNMPIEMINRQEYEEWLSIFKRVQNLFGSMNWSPGASNIHDLQDRIKAILDKHNY